MSDIVKSRKRRASFEDLLLAGISEIADKGIDHVSVSDVATASSVSRPTFYTYFGDIPGFFAEIWLHHGRAWLEAQVSDKSEIQPDLDQALLEIFAASRRMPEVFEVVQPDFEKWWREKVGHDQLEGNKLVWTLGFHLGYRLASKVSHRVKLGLPVVQILDYPKDVLTLPLMAGLSESTVAEFGHLPGLRINDDSVESILTKAAVEVVASAGVAATSMTRVARRARVSTGSLYPRFKSADQLIERSFEVAIQNIVAANVETVKSEGIGPDQYAMTINSGFGENRKTWRNFRTEMHLEAAHNKKLAGYMEAGFEETARFLEDNFVAFGSPREFAAAMAWFLHSHAIGTSMIFNQVPEIANYDNRVMTRWIISQLPKV